MLASGFVLAAPAAAQPGNEAEALTAQIVKLADERKYAEAIRLAQRLLALREKELGPEHPGIVKPLGRLASLYHDEARYADAEALYRCALVISEKTLGPDHPDVATAVTSLAALYRDLARYGDAEALYKRALAIHEKALGPNSPELANAHYNLAVLYGDLDRYPEAEAQYKRALAIREKALGLQHPTIAVVLNGLAALYEEQTRYADALPLYERALRITEKRPGSDQPDIGSALTNLSSLYGELGRSADAELLDKRTLAIRQKVLHAPDSLAAAPALTHMAEFYISREEAELLYKRVLAIYEKARGPDHADVAIALTNVGGYYYRYLQFRQAEPYYRRALSIREKVLGPDHPDVATTLTTLAKLKSHAAEFGDPSPAAEPEELLRRALRIREKTFGPTHPEVAWSLSNLATLYKDQDRYADAEPLYRQALAILEGALGPHHLEVAKALTNLAKLIDDHGQPAEAAPLYKRSLAIREKVLGADNIDVAKERDLLADLYNDKDNYIEAEPLLKSSLASRERRLGREHPDVADRLETLGHLYTNLGRYDEAEPLLKRALTIREKTPGADIADPLNCLGLLYWHQGRNAEAEALFKRSLAMAEERPGSAADWVDKAAKRGTESAWTGTVLNNLGLAYHGQHRYAEAEPIFKQSLSIREKALGPDHLDVAQSLNNLAWLYLDQERYAEAEPLARRSLSIREKLLPPDHPSVGESLNNLALLFKSQGRYTEAEGPFNRALEVAEKALGADHPHVGATLANLAALRFEQGDWVHAADFARRSTSIVIGRAFRGSEAVGRAQIGKGKSESEQHNYWFWRLVRAAHHLVAEGAPEPPLADEMFQMAQWVSNSDAATSLTQMAARGAMSDAKLAAIVRERQDLVREWQKRDVERNAAISRRPDNRDKAGEAANGARLDAIDTRIREIDSRLAKDFPDYAALASPRPLSVADVQAQLRDGEALVQFLATPADKPDPEENFIWVVTKTDSRWVKSDIGPKALGDRVAALRCGLDSSNWTDASSWPETTEEAKRRKDTQTARRDRCKVLTGLEVADGEPLPFDIAKANELYRVLFGQVEELLKNPDGTFRHLLVVPSGPLTQLPFQVLVTGSPEEARMAGYRSAAWLIRRHAVTVVPSVASLAALRRNAKTTRATKPLIGFGNPLLDGNPEKPWQVEAARRARAKQRCPEAMQQQVASLTGLSGGAAPFAEQKGVSDVAQIRFQAPLPETADELCAVASDLGVPRDEIRLGSQATERAVKALSSSGTLATYRILQFSTHGALAGHMSGNAEPGLLLTPPVTATPEDDGYLSASEITSLKLDADWVILSACDTAAGGADGAEALSGLARAFFYAGARALLVSHWSVYSDSTVKLITKAVSTMAADSSVGRSEALRRSMVALIEKGQPQEAQPAFWAPFIVVGEGGAPIELAAANMPQSPPADTSSVVPMVSAAGSPPALVPPKKRMNREPAAGGDWATKMFGQ